MMAYKLMNTIESIAIFVKKKTGIGFTYNSVGHSFLFNNSNIELYITTEETTGHYLKRIVHPKDKRQDKQILDVLVVFKFCNSEWRRFSVSPSLEHEYVEELLTQVCDEILIMQMAE